MPETGIFILDNYFTLASSQRTIHMFISRVYFKIFTKEKFVFEADFYLHIK